MTCVEEGFLPASFPWSSVELTTHPGWGSTLRREGKGEELAASGADGQRRSKDVCLRLHYVHKHIGFLCDLCLERIKQVE